MRTSIIESLLNKAARLPPTISHGDLRPDWTTLHPDFTLGVNDWERAVVGPAGSSLYMLFGGCATATAILGEMDDASKSEQSSREFRMIAAYIDTLENGRYATKRELVDGLPGAVCAGAINSVLWYTNYSNNQAAYRKSARRHIESSLSDLLDLCDLLALADRDTAFASARDYRENGRSLRAINILRRYASMHPKNSQVHVKLAKLLHDEGNLEDAIVAYRKSISLALNEPALHQALGDVLLERLRFGEATTSFDVARRLGVSAPSHNARMALLGELRRCGEDASRDDVVPSVTLGESEINEGKWRPERLALGAKLFRRYGVLLIRNVFDEKLLEACKDYYIKRSTR